MAPNDVVGRAASQALDLATTISGTLPGGIPLLLVFSTSQAVINLFTATHEPALTLTRADFERAMSEIADHISDATAKQSAKLAGGKIRTAYEWYAKYNARVSGGEQFTRKDLDEIETAVQDALGPNSSLIEGLNILSHVEIGKFDCVTYALGASLFAKLGLMEIGVQVNRGEQIASGQWSWQAKRVKDLKDCLHSLMEAANRYGLQKLDQWAKKHPGHSDKDFIAQRDRLMVDLIGGQEVLDRLKSTHNQLDRGAMNYTELAKKAS